MPIVKTKKGTKRFPYSKAGKKAAKKAAKKSGGKVVMSEKMEKKVGRM